MKKELELGQKFHEILEYYQTLESDQQRTLITALAKLTKKPPYYITFKLDNKGIVNMSKAITYCEKYQIPYKPEKLGNTRVRFAFKELSERNKVLIGRLTF